MCIRDRECGLPAATVQAIENPDRALVGEMLKMDKYIDMPVSYTHLDVYKRQGQESLRLFKIICDIAVRFE